MRVGILPVRPSPVDRQRVGQSLRSGQFLGEAPRKGLPLLHVQLAGQGKLYLAVQTPVGALVFVCRFPVGARGALLRNSRSRRTGPRSSSASVHALRSWHSKLRHPVQHSALDRGFDFLVLDRAGREAYSEYRLVP